MGFFKEIEIDILEMHKDQFPVEAIAKILNVSIPEVERVIDLQEDCDYDSDVVTYDDLVFEPRES